MIQISVGNLMSSAGDISDTLAQQIRQEFSYYVPDYERFPEFQFGRWDGKNYLFLSVAGEPGRWRFPTGLLRRLLTWLYSRQIPYQVTHDLPATTPDPSMEYLRQGGYQIYPYQVEAAVAATTTLVGRAGGVLRIATGGGKTVVIAKVLQIRRVPTVIFVNTADLLDQWYEELTESLKCPIGRVGDGHCDVRDITIATVQTTCRAFEITAKGAPREREVRADLTAYRQFIRERIRAAVHDECHGVAATTVYECVFLCRNVLAIDGLSASPWRDDGLDILIEAACGPIVYTKTASDLIEMINPATGRSYLVPPRITAYDLPEPAVQTPAHVDTSRPNEFHWAWIVENEERNRFIRKLALDDVADGRVVLILVRRVEHGKMLEAIISGSRFVHGKKSSKVRKAAFDAIRTGELRCLIATTLADQGLDLPIVSSLILASAGMSSTRALQRVGRALRDHPAKADARVHDLIDAHYVFKRHWHARERIYQTERCFSVHRTRIAREQIIAL